MNNILVIQLSRMGDIVQTIPLLLSLQRAYPTALLSFLCVKEFADILSTFGLDEFCIGVPAALIKDLQGAAKPEPELVEKIIKEAHLTRRFDLAINCNYEAGAAALLARIDANEKRGRILNPSIDPCLTGDWSKYMFAFTKKRVINLFSMADIYQGLAGTIGANKYLAPFINENDRIDAAGLLKSYGYSGKTRLVAFQLGTSNPLRSWGIPEFAEVARNLMIRDDVAVAAVGGPADVPRAMEFVKLVKRPIINLVGKTTLKNLPSVLAHCRLLITNDTGPMHIANLAGVRILSIHLASAYFAETAPYGEGHILVQSVCDCYPCLPNDLCSDMKCKEQISPKAISVIANDIISNAIPATWNLPDVSVYQTAFLDNHTLGFIPKSETIPVQYLCGFYNRIMWEKILDLPGDELFITSITEVLKKIRQSDEIRGLIDKQLTECIRILDRCLLASQKLSLALDTNNSAALQSSLSEFKNAMEELSQGQDSPLVFFHTLDFSNIGMGDLGKEIRKLCELLIMRKQRMLAAQDIFKSNP